MIFFIERTLLGGLEILKKFKIRIAGKKQSLLTFYKKDCKSGWDSNQ